MGRSKDSSDWDGAGILLLFLIVPAVIGGIAAVIAKIGGMLAALGWLWVPILFLSAGTLTVVLVETGRRRRRAALEAEEQRQRDAAISESRKEQRRVKEREAARKKAEAQEREIARKKAEEERRRAITRQKAERRRQVEELGESAVKLIERAESAASRVVQTEAASMGWLGDPHELDFSPDLLMITTTLKSGAQLRQLADELRALPDHSDEDRARLADAKRAAEKLWRQASDRANLLRECATQACRIDESLQEERERARIAGLRDDVASRLDAALYGAAATPESPPSDSPDKVFALVAAYQEIKGTLELDRQGRCDDKDDATDTPADNGSSWGVLTPVNRAWHWAFG
ncbi:MULTISPECIES: hypothetical protein [Mycobacteriaceae]|uniref:hypothetical protein n=1 Tax=Mycobacteriaceae TaxID=1762 RepID=UPI000DCD2DC0|nr:hypothetical protein [Mycolicibacter senuensis]RAU99785.1 hypothetical protein DQP56_10325 [Mycolicibacter senuensis]